MNQTKKRLSIIKLAISITDIETIQLQILKLGLLQTDLKIQDIITALQAENYARAQGLITLYIESPTENILQRTSQKKKPVTTAADKTTIEEFHLFVTENKDEKKREIDINDFYVDAFESRKSQSKEKEVIQEVNLDDFLNDALNIEVPRPNNVDDEKVEKKEVIQEIDINDFFKHGSEAQNSPEQREESIRGIDINDFLLTEHDLSNAEDEEKEVSTEIDINDFLNDALQAGEPREKPQGKSADFDVLLNIDSDDVMTDNITLNISDTSNDTFFGSDDPQEREAIDTSDIPKDTFFDTQEPLTQKILTEKILTEKSVIDEMIIEEPPQSEALEEIEQLTEKKTKEEEPFFNDSKPTLDTQEETDPSAYKAIPYIEQKLKNMQKQYPAVEQDYEKFSTVENLLKKISREEYSESEIEETLSYIKQLIKEKQFSQAAQLLLICAATESKFAQFILGRELYKGTVLTKNIPEAFNLINTLAMDDYPEALCDLGQFHENGIGTKKDIKRARELYKEAMELGIKRADSHHARLQKSRRGLFSR
jgi:hypothetical protein